MSSTDFRLSIDIDAPPDRVWGVMRDVERWPEWTPTVTSVRLVDAGPLAAGSRAIIRQPKLPPARWRVIGLDEAGRKFTWLSRGPGVSVIASHWVEPRGNASVATLSLRFAGIFAGLFGHILKDLNNRYLAIEAKGLKDRCETG